jgi:hypothetical protein
MEDAMRDQCDNRLSVIGPRREVRRFQNSSWEKIMGARYLEPLEFFPRYVCQFATNVHDLNEPDQGAGQSPCR